MKIHLIEADEKPTVGVLVKASCGKEIIFEEPISIMYDEDGRLCEKCYYNHRNSKIKLPKHTFAHCVWEDGER